MSKNTLKWTNVNLTEGSISHTSTSLLRKAKADDADAWKTLVETYSRSIYRWCRRAGLQPADASNIVQEVLRSVARKLPEFRKERKCDTFRGWLRRITQNKLRDYFRKQTKQIDRASGGTDAHQLLHNQREEIDKDDDNSSTVTANQTIQEFANPVVDKVRGEFSERDWRFFWRIIVDGQSAVEVGAEFGVTANTVRIVKMRILRRLREEFAEKG